MNVMKTTAVLLGFLCLSAAVAAQAPPPLIPFNGVARDAAGQPRAGVLSVTFAIYATNTGGEALWQETQAVETDETGHYDVILGAYAAGGVPLALFQAGGGAGLACSWTVRAKSPVCCLRASRMR